MSHRMNIVWGVLESAKDAGEEMVIAACRRLIVADRLGWRKHHSISDYAWVCALYNDILDDARTTR